MSRSVQRRWAMFGFRILGLLAAAGCKPDHITAASPPPEHADTRADEPHLGPVRSYSGLEAQTAYAAALEAELSERAARRRAAGDATIPSEREVELATSLSRLRQRPTASTSVFDETTTSDDPIFFVEASTRVGITPTGRRSNANVMAVSQTNRKTTIKHQIGIELTTPEGTRNFPPVLDEYEGTSTLTTTIPVAGINCTTRARLFAETAHHAGGFFDSGIAAYSLDEATCGGEEECEASDEPPTAVAPGPSEPGYGYGDGSSGTTGGCDGTGGTTPPSSNCHDEYVYVESSTDGGMTWTVIWEGWSIVCV